MKTTAGVILITAVMLLWVGSGWAGDIYEAASSGDVATVKTLLAGNPGLVNAKDNDSTTPLHWAANNGSKEVVELLLAYGADINAKTKYGRTPLDWTLSRKHEDIAGILRAHGAQPGTPVKEK